MISHNLTKKYYLTIDYKLELNIPTTLNLPLGSNYQILIKNDLLCNYSIYPLNNNYNLDINYTGLINSNEIGEYLIIVKYNQQFLSINLRISIPSFLYLFKESSNIFLPILLDKDGQKYSIINNINYSFNNSLKFYSYLNHQYSFEIKEKTYLEIKAFKKKSFDY